MVVDERREDPMSPDPNDQAPATTAPAPPKPARKRSARRATAGATKPKASRKTDTSRKSAPRDKATRKKTPATFESALAGLGRRADEARAKLLEMTGESAAAASKSLANAGRATRGKLDQLEKGWKKMTPAKRAAAVAGVLGAIAAAVATPIVAARAAGGKRRR
jgi:hypothetical protein